MFQRILVPLDGSRRAEQAIPLAARIARASGGSLFLVHAVEPFPLIRAYTPFPPADRLQIEERERNEAASYLAEIAMTETLANLTVHHAVVSGSPPLGLLQVIQQEHIDLVILCSHGYTGLKRWALGSVAQKVACHSAVPVLIVQERQAGEKDLPAQGTRSVSVMVALDGSACAEAVIQPAAHLSCALSDPLPGTLHLVQVIPLVVEPVHVVEFMRPRPRSYDVLPLDETRMLEAAATYLEHIQKQIQKDVGNPERLRITASVLTNPDVAGSLLAEAEQTPARRLTEELQGCDMLAMATHGRGGLARWTMGSVTQRVLSTTRQPLLIVRPFTPQKKTDG